MIAAGVALSSEHRASYRFSVFISYNHQDRAWAGWLHRSLEQYRIPKGLRGRESSVGVLGARLPPVFQDREELAASPDLAASIEDALSRSANLIVLCSPNAARSRWVNEEVSRFRDSGRRDNIHCLIVDGGGAAADSGDLANLFPPALLADGGEPLAADARPEQDGKRAALLKLIAGVIGVSFDDLRQREQARRQRRLAVIATASAAGSVLTTGLAAVALISRNEAIHQRDVARQKTLTAQRTTEFVKGLFEVNDPSEAKGDKVTARQILDKGAREIGNSLSTEPNVRAELGTTLSQVYLSLGLFRRADALVRQSLTWNASDPVTRARQFDALGDAQTRNGDYPSAIRSYDRALALANGGDDAAGLVTQTLIGRAEALSAIGRYESARRDVASAYAKDRAREGERSPVVARDLEAAGLNADFSGKFNEARADYERALAIRIRVQGVAHPRVSDDYNELGSLAYLQGDSSAAERFWRRSLRSDMIVLGPDHPDVAATLNNIGRVMLERRAFADAEPLLRRSVAINLAQRDDTQDDLAFIFANLAHTEWGLGRPKEAKDLFERALRAADLHEHRNRAPIMTDLAWLLCTERQFDRAQGLLQAAAPLMRKTYPDDPWRSAWVENTRGYCLLQQGAATAAAPLLRASAPEIDRRWKPDTLYGFTVAARLRALDHTVQRRRGTDS